MVENLYIFEASSAKEVLELYKFGVRSRVLAAHNLNEVSSRSHTIFSITLETQDLKDPNNLTVSKLQLVDLAGSEKQSQTGTTGQQAKEATTINQSLHVLRKVITALTSSDKFIPYRESKLTSLLKQSLGGNSFTVMIACLSPCDFFAEENLSSLQYAAKTSCIKNLPVKNVDPKLLVLNDQKRKISDLEFELRQASSHIQNLSILQAEKDQKIERLTRKVDTLSKKNDVLSKIPNSELQSPRADDLLNRTLGSFTNPDEDQSQRLVDSVNAVTELLKANTELRDQVDKLIRDLQDKEAENHQLQLENQSLRERLEIVESILKQNSKDFDSLLTSPIKKQFIESSSKYGSFGNSGGKFQDEFKSIDDVY